MDALGLKAQSNFQSYTGMRRVGLVRSTSCTNDLCFSDCQRCGILRLACNLSHAVSCICRRLNILLRSLAASIKRSPSSSSEAALQPGSPGQQEGREEADGEAAYPASPLTSSCSMPVLNDRQKALTVVWPLQVVLKQDVQNLGTKGTITTVPNGFYRNFLKPQNIADLATQGILM